MIYFSCEYELQFASPLSQEYFVSEFHRLITHCSTKCQFSLFPQTAFIFIVPAFKVGICYISFVFSSQSSSISLPSKWKSSSSCKDYSFLLGGLFCMFATGYGKNTKCGR